MSVSPTGVDFILSDGGSGYRGAISQTISGLSQGASYDLSFYWATGQFADYTGATTEQWQVSLGGSTQSTVVHNTTSHGFDPWTKATMTFTADASQQVLSFMAIGTITGLPPSSMLDGVSLTAVPESATWAKMILGVGVVGSSMRRRRRMVAFA